MSETKKEYAMQILAALKGKGGVVVLPVFIEDAPGVWSPSDEVAISGANPDWCAVNVMAIQSSFSDMGFENERVMSALIRRKTIGTEDKYKAGQVLSGKIAIMETLTPTDVNDDSRDAKAPSAAHAEAGIYCTVGGQPIYLVETARSWEVTTSMPAPNRRYVVVTNLDGRISVR